jgi:hypothetical protein
VEYWNLIHFFFWQQPLSVSRSVNHNNDVPPKPWLKAEQESDALAEFRNLAGKVKKENKA